MVRCECGHESCFHRAVPSGVSAMFNRPAPGAKSCNVKDCMCLRFTPKEA